MNNRKTPDPSAPGHSQPAREPTSSHISRKISCAKVLVVDDEPLVRWAVAETLAASGYDVSEAGDAGDAVRTLSDNGAPDLFLLDLQLPDCADLRLVETFRQLAPNVPVILMTAFGTDDIRDAARRLGVVSVLDKPFNLDGLDATIARALPTAR